MASNSLFCSHANTVFALSLIWAAFEETDESFLLLPNDLKYFIKATCQDIDLNLEINTIDKIAIEPTDSGAELGFINLLTLKMMDKEQIRQGSSQAETIL